MFINNPDVEMIEPENSVVASQPLKSRQNIYAFRDNTPTSGKVAKSQTTETMSVRSPSSLATTHTTKFGSQGSLRSAISLKDSTMSPISPQSTLDKGSNKYSERGIDAESHASTNGKYDDSSRLINRSKDNIVSSERPPRPVAANRRNLSNTHLIDGIPQTEV